MRLDDNSNTQRELNQEAFHTDMDLKSKQMQQNIEVGGFKNLTGTSRCRILSGF